MRKFLSVFENENEKRFNFALINREDDEDLVNYVVESTKALEIIENIKFIGYEFTDDEKKVDLSEYNALTRKSKSKKKEKVYKYRSMQDSRYGEITLKFELHCKGETKRLDKKLILPIPDDDGYYTINGKKYIMIWQLVDASTYTHARNLTLKSMMAVPVTRTSIMTPAEENGMAYSVPMYMMTTAYSNRKAVNILNFYAARMGITELLRYFELTPFVRIVEKPSNEDGYMFFQRRTTTKANHPFTVGIEVKRDIFEKFQYVQSMVGMLADMIPNEEDMINKLDDIDFWITELGRAANAAPASTRFAKGMSVLKSFKYMEDETSKRILKVSSYQKQDIFSIVRWMIQNYNELRQKNNMDLENKRLRGNEYIAAMLTQEYSNRLSTLRRQSEKSLTMKKVEDLFKFPGNIIIEKLHQSKLLRISDAINDLNFPEKLRYTIKGPNAHGGKNTKNISTKYKGIDPSFIGRIDLNVAGSSDPGSSGSLTPFAKTSGLYFKESNEPESAIFELVEESRHFFSQFGGDPEWVYVNALEKATDFDAYARIQSALDLGANVSIKQRGQSQNG